jgi:hypothetical protein
MNLKVTGFNTFPNKKDSFWQVVLIPTVSILNSIDRYDKYVAINLEWCFWSVCFIIGKN